MLHALRFFSLQNAVYFIMLPCLVPFIIRILHKGCAKILMPNSDAKRLNISSPDHHQHFILPKF
jgi:hypothetical protein